MTVNTSADGAVPFNHQLPDTQAVWCENTSTFSAIT